MNLVNKIEIKFLKIISNIHNKRIRAPDDISSLTKFLASDKASYITGQTFHVNGGMFM